MDCVDRKQAWKKNSTERTRAAPKTQTNVGKRHRDAEGRKPMRPSHVGFLPEGRWPSACGNFSWRPQPPPLNSSAVTIILRNCIQHHRCTIVERLGGVSGPILAPPTKVAMNLSELSSNLKQYRKHQAFNLMGKTIQDLREPHMTSSRDIEDSHLLSFPRLPRHHGSGIQGDYHPSTQKMNYPQ